MDPVFQRLGDVTIQRLEKPKDKVGPQAHSDTLEKEGKDEKPSDSVNIEEIHSGVKRNFECIAGPSNNKKTKFEKCDIKKPNDDNSANSFSEGEITDYESDFELESDEDIATMKSQNSNLESATSELETESTDFLEKLVQEPFVEEGEIKPVDEIKTEIDDYDYDIKEKLKEMGEISFETVKKGEKPKKTEICTENEVVVTPAKKPGILDDDPMCERKGLSGNLRRNIREVMDETKLDESTLAAQRQEMERLRRVQEQQRLIREVQRQMAQDRVISLLQGNAPKASTSGGRIGSTVLVKLPNGQTKTMTKLSKRPFELLRVPKSAVPPHKNTKSVVAIKKPPGNLTPSVSIAPVMKRPHQFSRPHSDTDSENEEMSLLRRPMARPKAKDPVPTIDISSDDDCIVVSESENDPSDEGDDPSNSGMHTNDEFNQPDEQGRVVINIGHPDGESDLYIAPQIARIIKPHQIGGVRFLFDNVIESICRFETSTGFGCILAHSMGLGKTLQVVCFSDIFLRHTPAKTILCIMPINTLQNWLAEYNMWLPTEEGVANSPLNAHGEVRPRNFNLHVLNDSHKTLVARAKVIHEWNALGGVLLIGYEQYRLLSLKKHPKSRTKKPVAHEPVDDDKNKRLFDEVHEALVKPGPDLVICDEGHRIKNSHASISQALKQMRTKRRVVLTGYPLQNNLMEYWCMVDFVRPNYLGTKTEFCNMFERPIQNGQCIDSTEADIKLMRYRAHVLHSLLVGFVQRRSHTVLQTALPQKEEYVLLIRMTDFQRTLYETFMNEVVRTQTVPNPLKAFAVCCKIWNHPDVLYYFLKKQAGGEAVDIDLEEVSNSTASSNESAAKTKKGSKRNTPKGKNAGKPAASVTPYNSSGDPSTKTPQKAKTIAQNLLNKSTAQNVPNSPSTFSHLQNQPIGQSNPIPIPPTPQGNLQNPPQNQNFPLSNPPANFGENIQGNFQNNATSNYTPNNQSTGYSENSQHFSQNSQGPIYSHTTPQANNSQDGQFQQNNQQPVSVAQSSNFLQNNQFGNFSQNNQPNNFSQNNQSGNFSQPGQSSTVSQDSNFGSFPQNQSGAFTQKQPGVFPPGQISTFAQSNQQHTFSHNQLQANTPQDNFQNNQVGDFCNTQNSNFSQTIESSNYSQNNQSPNFAQNVPRSNVQPNSHQSSNFVQAPNNFNQNTEASSFNQSNQPGNFASREQPGNFIQGNQLTSFTQNDQPGSFTSNDQPGSFNQSNKRSNFSQLTRPSSFNENSQQFNQENQTPNLLNIDSNQLSNYSQNNQSGNFQMNNQGSNFTPSNPVNISPNNQSGNNIPVSFTENSQAANSQPKNISENFPQNNQLSTFSSKNQQENFSQTNQTGSIAPPNSYQSNNFAQNSQSSFSPNNQAGNFSQPIQSNFPPNQPINFSQNSQPGNVPLSSQPGSVTPLNTQAGNLSLSSHPANETINYSQDNQILPLNQQPGNFTQSSQPGNFSENNQVLPANQPGIFLPNQSSNFSQHNKTGNFSHNNQSNVSSNPTNISSNQPVNFVSNQTTNFTTNQPGNFQSNQVGSFPQNKQSSNLATNTSSNFNSQSSGKQTNFSSNIQNKGSSNSSISFPPSNTQSNFPQNQPAFSPNNNSSNQNQQLQTSGNFQNYQQNYWGPQDPNFKQPNECFNNFRPPYNQNLNINPNQTWIKKEDSKPIISSLITNTIKTEDGISETKPKINIISDIKLSSGTGFDMKKINILSDIKLEPMEFGDKEENPDIKDIKVEPKLEPSDEDIKPTSDMALVPKIPVKEDTGIPYDWAIELLKDYVPGCIENSAKMEILFCIIRESIALGDRLLVFSQSLITLDLIEQFLQMNIVPGESHHWAKNLNYYRLDGSTSALEREKLINEFNSNSKIYLFLVSTRAGSLGINLIGANRVVVLDASWNPCHDTQAVCRVYRYGQRKPCFVYRLVVDNCLEKKIYDRQINKQGMSDRVVDECNPDAHLTMKDVSTLCWDDAEEGDVKDWSHYKDNYIDVVLQKVLVQYGTRFNKEPFQHESLLVDRKDKQLSQQEKRLAKKGYEREKQAARQPAYNVGSTSRGHRPVASVRPMQQGGERPTRWIPAEHWQRQGMTAQEMTLPLDVVIPTNQADKGNIVLKAGQKVLVLKSPKGVYMQLESGKIVAIKTAIKVRGKAEDDAAKVKPNLPPAIKNNSAISVLPQKRAVKPFTPGMTKLNMRSIKQAVPNLISRIQSVTKKVQMAKTKPYQIGQEIARAVNQGKSETESHPSSSDEERMHVEKRHFNFAKDSGLTIEPRIKTSNHSRSELLERSRDLSNLDIEIEHHSTKSKNYRHHGYPKSSTKSSSSALEQLEQSTSAIMSDPKQPFQETLDSITSTYPEEEKLSDTSSHASTTHSAQQSSQSISSSSDQEVIPVEDQSYQHENESVPTSSSVPPSETIKSEIPTPDYGYNNYYGYNHMQPYPPPPQGYPGYPHQPPPYDMMGYPQPQQPQYNYGMYPPQNYPPQPQYPPQGPYDYGQPPPPQPPVYAGYHTPYPPQQYPPPPQGMYPPPAPGYPDYQYNHGPPPPHTGPAPPPPAAPFYPGH